MKVKLRQLAESRNALTELVQIPLPASVSFKLRKIVELSNAELTPAQEALLSSREKYLLDDGEFDQSKSAEYVKEVEELMEQEVEIDSDPISAESLGDVYISTQSLMTLDWLIS